MIPERFQCNDISIDETHRRWIASRNQPDMEEPEEPEAVENEESMDVDNDDTMGFIGSHRAFSGGLRQ